MVLCGIFNIFNKKTDFRKMIDASQGREIILNEFNEKVEIAQDDYTKSKTNENMFKYINAVNMRNKYLVNNNIQDNRVQENIQDRIQSKIQDRIQSKIQTNIQTNIQSKIQDNNKKINFDKDVDLT